MSAPDEPAIDLGARVSSHGAAVGDPLFYVGSALAVLVAAAMGAAVPMAGLLVIAATILNGWMRKTERDVQLVFHERGILHRVGRARRRVPFERMRAVRLAKVDALIPAVACAIDVDDGTTLVLSPHLEDLEAHAKRIEERMHASTSTDRRGAGAKTAADTVR